MFEMFSHFTPHITAPKASGLWFLLPVAALSLYVIWIDLRSMRIPNRSVLLLFAIFVVLGPFALPLPEYGLRLAQAAAVLAIGFVLHLFGGIGAGDVKFMAAASPMISRGDGELVLLILAAALLSAFATHRLFRALPFVRGAAPDWISWNRRDFPMGFALGVSLVIYLILVAVYGA